MKRVDFNSGNGWCYIAFDGAKKGLVSYEEEEILPCEFDFISTHIEEIWATIQYKNVIFQLCYEGPDPQRTYYPSYEEAKYFTYGETGLFTIEKAPFLIEQFQEKCNDDPSLKEPETDQNTIDLIFTELRDLLSKNHHCTKEEYQRRRKL